MISAKNKKADSKYVGLYDRALQLYSFQAPVEAIAKELGISVRLVISMLIEAKVYHFTQPPLEKRITKAQQVQQIEAALGLEGKLSSFEKADKAALEALISSLCPTQ